MGRRRDTPDFTRSNKIPALEYQPASGERDLTARLIASTSARERETLGQKLLDDICRSLKIPRARLRVFEERQPHKLRGGRLAYKLYGVYHCDSAVIEIANLTSIRKQVVAGKTFLDTLIHEIMHHIDRKFLRIPSTPHSPGFYARIEDLKAKLMRGRGGERASPQEAAWQKPKNLTAALETAVTDARSKNDHHNGEQPNEAVSCGSRAEARNPRWTQPGEPVPITRAKPEETSAAKPPNKPPDARGEENISSDHPPKDASGEKEPQLSFDFE
ncbi:MAG: hypothetical protein OXL41_08475 [Nitrospinae bacterium]|nr:hypothetical protein [Nitrospinota bacterium]